MEHDPTTARLAHGRLARLRSLRARTRTAPTEVVADPVPGPATPTVPRGLADAGRVVAALTRQGHAVRVTDRTSPGDVPVAADRAARVVLEEIVSVLGRCATSDQRVHVRIRTEDGELVLGVQTLPEGDRARPLTLGPRDESAIRRCVDGAAGRATIRTTHGGNWLAVVRLPL